MTAKRKKTAGRNFLLQLLLHFNKSSAVAISEQALKLAIFYFLPSIKERCLELHFFAGREVYLRRFSQYLTIESAITTQEIFGLVPQVP